MPHYGLNNYYIPSYWIIFPVRGYFWSFLSNLIEILSICKNIMYVAMHLMELRKQEKFE